MKKLAFAFVAGMIAISGCTTAETDAAGGAVVGGVIGGLVSGDAGGALVGAAVGGVSGVLIGKASRRGWCRYRDRSGRIYEARCR